MSNRKKSKKKLNQTLGTKEKGIESVDQALAWVFIITVCILPLLIRVKVVQFVSPQIIDSGFKTDIFTYYKFVFLLLFTFAAVGLLVFKMVAYQYKLSRSYINAPLLALALLTLLSGLFAEHLNISMFGMYDRHEGTLTYLCYFALFFVAANTRFQGWFTGNIIAGLSILISVNVIIILFDFYGFSIINNQFIKMLVVPSYLPVTGLEGHLNSTLNNPNYVSGFSASLTAFFMTLALLEETWLRRVFYSVLTILSFTMMLASLSASGIVTLVMVLPVIFILVMMSKKRLHSMAAGVTILAACSLVLMILNIHNPRVWEESVGSFKGFAESIKTETSLPPVSKVTSFLFPKQSEAAPLGPSPNIDGQSNANTLTQEPVQQTSTYDEFNLPKSSMGAGSGRIYIWKETLKLIKQRPLLGYGHDTLLYFFPQNDPAKVANLRTYDVVVTKPHNIYLDLVYSSGIIALVAFLGLMFKHIYSSAKKIITAGNNPGVFPAALLTFTCAFLVQWIFNDSIIGTSVIFWTLLGVSVSMNSNKDSSLNLSK